MGRLSWFRYLVFVAFYVFAAWILMEVAGASSASAGVPSVVHGSSTHMGSVQVPYSYAATHHGDSQWTFVQGSVLRISGHRGWGVVRVTDTCAGSSCKMLDLSLAMFEDVVGPGSQGVGTVYVRCGRGGHLPMRKCIAGEDE